MAITWLVSDALLDSVSPILEVSMSASAAILFTMPTAPAAQPVPLILVQLRFLVCCKHNSSTTQQ